MKFRIHKGLDVPLDGHPDQVVGERKPVSSVALIGADYVGLSPTVLVEVEDRVRLGQSVVRDSSGYELTAPGTGVVREIRRGHQRSLVSLVIELDDPAGEDAMDGTPPRAGADGVAEGLLASGLWTALRERPFGRVADPATRPRSIFVTAIDTDPLAARPELVLAGSAEDFERGVDALTHLARTRVHVCKAPGEAIPIDESARVAVHEFSGPHPAGLPGTHIHFVDPVDRGRTAWYVDCTDVVAIGRLVRTGELVVDRVIALAGPRVERPRLLRARLGANIDDLTAGELAPGGARVVSGSALGGRQATSWGRHLGRYHRQICALEEPRSAPSPRATHTTTTELHGHTMAMVPSGSVERVVPLDLLLTPLLRALLVGDLAAAEALGCLELDEEDLALCTYACPSKIEYGAYLRDALERLRGQG
jgi:Na+-transporting NADH:ubiquinone oxidoreductase subunit A